METSYAASLIGRVLIFLLLSSGCSLCRGENAKGNVNGTTIIGIDLGTTYSCVAVFKDGRVKIIPNDEGNRITASYVAFTRSGQRLVGDAAKQQLTSNPENTIFDAKRLIGRDWNDPSVQQDIKHYPFKVVNQNGKPVIKVTIANKVHTFTPEQISAMVLGQMKAIAETYLGQTVSRAVVTVPAYFNDAQRAATKDAGRIAGLDILRIINEPTAAAIAYGLLDRVDLKNVLVFDLGGGTFDVSLLTIDNGIFEVIATNGDTHLGGEDFDLRIVEHMVRVFREKHRRDLRDNPRAVQLLRREAERAKRELSSQHQTRLEVESIYAGIDLSETLTRSDFEELNMDYFEATIKTVGKVLDDGGMTTSQIDEVVLVGGSTRIPKIQQLVKQYFRGKEPYRGMNPDEAVAHGAAVQAATLRSAQDSKGDAGPPVVLLDVNPLTLGIMTEGGVMTVIIPRNSIVPTKKQRSFTTMEDDQPNVHVRVFEGERALVKDNHEIGSFSLKGIRKAPRGTPDIEVTFHIDVNGILQVSAEDKANGNTEQITITSNQNRLSQKEIDKMIQQAARFAEDDKQAKARVEARNELEYLAYSLLKQVRDKGSLAKNAKLPEEDRTAVIEEATEVLTWLEKNPDATAGQLTERLTSLEAVVRGINTELHAESMRRPLNNGTQRWPLKDEL